MLEEERHEEEASVTERRRSRSGVTDAAAPPAAEVAESPAGPNPAEQAELLVITEDVASDHEVQDEGSLSDGEADEALPVRGPRLVGARKGKGKGRRLVKKSDPPRTALSAQQRLLLLDTWQRSGLSAADFASLVGLSKHTLYGWKKRFDEQGPAGLMDRPRSGSRGSRLHEITKRTILMLKEAHPEYGCSRISDELARGPGLGANPQTIAKVLHEGGYEMEEVKTRPHPDKVRRFERARPNQLWQTDIFTFTLKRQNRRVYLVAFMDDHSRFITGYGLYASMSTALVLEVVNAGIANYGAPEEMLTDNGPQYTTWRGKSRFTRELEKRGIKQVVARPKRPQTLGKVERFWGTLWRECVEAAIFLDLEDARKRIGLFIDHYNFHRVHQGIEGLTPADRFFSAAEEVKKTLKARVAGNALDLARQGLPRKPFYMTGNVGGKGFSVHAEGERVYLTREDGGREEVDLADAESTPLVESAESSEELPETVCPSGPPQPAEIEDSQEPAPGTSALDEGLKRIAESTEGAAHEQHEL